MTLSRLRPSIRARYDGGARALGLVLRALLLLLAARLAAVPPTRPVGRSDRAVTGRVLHRYCDCAVSARCPRLVAAAPGSDPGAAAVASGAGPGHPTAVMAAGAGSTTAAFLIRPPAHLRC